MADPLSIVSGIAGVVALAGSVVSKCYTYGVAVKGGPAEIQRLLDELISLTGILNAVKSLTEASEAQKQGAIWAHDDLASDLPPPYSHKAPIDQLERLVSPLNGAQALLEKIEASLRKAEIKSEHRVERVFQRLLWPLKKQETQDLIAQLERFKTSFTLSLTSAHVSSNLELQDGLQDVKRGQQMDRLERQLEQQDAKLREVQKWLSPINCANAHRAARKACLDGTGSWMLQHRIWTNWLVAESSFLWLYGIPGSGKTVLTSTLLEDCYGQESTKSSMITFFYCDFREKDSQKPEYILGGLICQLRSQFEEPPVVFTDFLEKHQGTNGQNTTPTCQELEDLLTQMLQQAPSSIVVIDGLDECVERQSILHLLRNLPNMKSCSVRVLVTSRQLGDIEEAFTQYKSQSTRVHAVDHDIEAYISTSIATNSRLRRLQPDLRALVQETLQSGAHGMFRWVQCQLDSLGRLRTDREIRLNLRTLPRDLKETYNRVLERIDEADVGTAQRALSWLSYTSRPLRLTELVEALGTGEQTKRRDPESLWYPPDLLSVIGSLARYNADSDVIVLAHHSVKEHLEPQHLSENVQSFAVTQERANIEIGRTCLTYLLMEDFESGPCSNRDAFKCRWDQYPLLSYASRFWPLHARQYLATDQRMLQLACKLLDPKDTRNFRSWIEVIYAQGFFRYFQSVREAIRPPRSRSTEQYNEFKAVPARVTPLYYAASYGLEPVVQRLLDEGAEIDAKGGQYGGTALHAAVFRGHNDIAIMLLKAGANPSIRDDTRIEALQLSAWMSKNDKLLAWLEAEERKTSISKGVRNGA
jgi:Cdc6-like AAA superfamily ATPase